MSISYNKNYINKKCKDMIEKIELFDRKINILENLLDDQPGVLESAVIAVPHSDFGETPVAIIVPGRDKSPNLQQIESEIKLTLARYKHPRKIIIVDQLPRNTMGKVQKNILRNEYKELFFG